MREVKIERDMLNKIFFLFRARTMFSVLMNGRKNQKLRAKTGAAVP